MGETVEAGALHVTFHKTIRNCFRGGYFNALCHLPSILNKTVHITRQNKLQTLSIYIQVYQSLWKHIGSLCLSKGLGP